jgi:putative ABC transport system permease protein
VFVAVREIRRSIGRFSLLTGAVALLVVLLLFFQAVAGTLTLGLTGGIENNSADVLVYSDRARQNPVASFLPPGTGEAVAAVDGVAEVSEVGRIALSATGGDGEQEDVVVVGLGTLGFGGPADLADGRRAEGPGEAVVSTSSLSGGYELGEVVTAEGVELTVVGTADDAAFDVSPTFYVPFDDYARIVVNRAGAPIEAPVSWLAVRAADDVDPVALADSITASAAAGSGGVGLEALDRDSAAAALPGVGQVTQSFGILYLLLFIVVTIVTGVFFLILTVQKQRSLVLLRAVGAGRLDVVKPVLIQVLVVVGLGCLLGTGVAAALLGAARDTFGSALDPRTTALTIGFLLLLGVVASFGAVRRVLAVDPIEATTSGTI